MFFTYLWRELRRRARQAIFIAVGLALGIGLVITVTAASAGVKNAQSTVLHSLYGVGTDITVTKAPTAAASGGGGFGFESEQAGEGGLRLLRLFGLEIGIPEHIVRFVDHRHFFEPGNRLRGLRQHEVAFADQENRFLVRAGVGVFGLGSFLQGRNSLGVLLLLV